MYAKLGRNFLKNSDTFIKELTFKEQILHMLVQERLTVHIQEAPSRIGKPLERSAVVFGGLWKRQGTEHWRASDGREVPRVTDTQMAGRRGS